MLPIVLLAAVEMASGQTYTEVYAFTGGSDGSGPSPVSWRMLPATYYGTTSYGGPLGCGTVYELPVTGGEKTIHDLSSNWDGAYPKSGLIVDSAGNLYGTRLSNYRPGIGRKIVAGRTACFTSERPARQDG